MKGVDKKERQAIDQIDKSMVKLVYDIILNNWRSPLLI